MTTLGDFSIGDTAQVDTGLKHRRVFLFLGHETFVRLCRARDLLQEVPEEPALIKDVARESGMSMFHFIRRFEALFGATPHQIRINARLDRAKLLLARGQHSVTEVCMEVGFASLGSFSEMFSRRIGVAPSHFQRAARAMVQIPHQVPPRLFPGCLSLMGYLPPSVFRNFQEAPSSVLR